MLHSTVKYVFRFILIKALYILKLICYYILNCNSLPYVQPTILFVVIYVVVYWTYVGDVVISLFAILKDLDFLNNVALLASVCVLINVRVKSLN